MKICHAVYSLEMGGAEMLVAQLCREQRSRGHEVTICAYSKLGALGEKLIADGFDVYVPGEAAPHKTMWKYWRHFRRLRPNVVHCHNPAPTLQAAIAARFAGAQKVISTRHSLVAPPYDLKEERKYNLAALFCDWIVGVCETTCVNLRGIPGTAVRKIVCVYNGSLPIDTGAAFQRTDDVFRLLFVGRLAEVKSLPTLLKAVSIARHRVPGLEFWIVGDGPVRAALEAMVAELDLKQIVTFWGQQLQTQSFFAQANAFAMSSISEGMPMSMLQAMSAGLPVIATDVGGMAEVVTLAGCGLLSPVGDSERMAESIVELASNPELRADFAVHAVEAYNRRFTLEAMADGYDKLYTG